MVITYYMCEMCDTGHQSKEEAEVCEDACRKEYQKKKDALKEYHVVSDIIVNSFAVITCKGCGKTFQIPCICEHGRIGIERPYLDDGGLACPLCDTFALLDENATQDFFSEWVD